MEWFPLPVIESRNERKNEDGKEKPVPKGGGIVHSQGELIANSSANKSAPEEEIYLEPNPLEDIKQQNLRSVDAAAEFKGIEEPESKDYNAIILIMIDF